MARSFSLNWGVLPFARGHTGRRHLPWDTHLPPFTHTLPPTRPFFNFYTLFPYFNFYPHFSATLPPLESTFYPRSRFYTLFTPLGASLFTYPFLHLFIGGGTFLRLLQHREANRDTTQRPYYPHRGLITHIHT